MSRKWICGAAVLLFLVGCGKPGNDANQMATNTANGAAAGNQLGPGQSTTPGQANTVNAPAAAPEPAGPLEIPAGTPIEVILTRTLNSKVNQPGEEFQATLARPILMVEGAVAIPKGASLRGTIREREEARHV
jgi:type IV secretory pathway VirB10-like protein